MCPTEVHRWDQHRRMMLSGAGIGLGLIAALNLIVDPFGAYRWIRVPALRGYREKFESSIARAEILEHEPCELVILGSSRAQVALDPAQPAWGRSACNLAIGKASVPEIHAVLRRALDKSSVREIVWGLDFPSFDRRLSEAPDFSHSRFDPSVGSLEYHAGLLLGFDALRASLRVLRDYRADRRSPFGELGLTDPGVRVDEPRYYQRFLWALEQDVTRYSGPHAFVYDSSAAGRTAALVAQARRSGREMTLVILPSHALNLESLARYGYWKLFERWKRDLVEALAGTPGAGAPLWDCTGYAAPLREPVPPPLDGATSMRWHWDSSHVKREIGDRVIREIRGSAPRTLAGTEPAELCTRLDRRSLAGVLARIRRERSSYRRTAPPGQLAAIGAARRAQQAFLRTASVPALAPVSSKPRRGGAVGGTWDAAAMCRLPALQLAHAHVAWSGRPRGPASAGDAESCAMSAPVCRAGVPDPGVPFRRRVPPSCRLGRRPLHRPVPPLAAPG